MSNIQSGTQPDNLDISWMQEAEAAAQQMTDAAAEFTEMIDQKMNLTLPASLSKPEETDRDGGLVIKPKPQEFSSEDIDKAMSEITIPGDTKKTTHTEQSDIQTIIHSNQLQAAMNLRDSLHIESSQKQASGK